MDRVRPKRSNDTFKITDLVSAPKHGAQILRSPGHSICKLIWKEGNKMKTRQPPALPETPCQFHLCSSQLPLPIPWASLLPGKVTATCVQEQQHPLPGHWPELCFPSEWAPSFPCLQLKVSTARNCCHILSHQIPTPYKSFLYYNPSFPNLRYYN